MTREHLYNYRTGKHIPPQHIEIRLETAEREAGVTPPFQEQFATASGEDTVKLLESATRRELFRVMPASVQQKLLEGDLAEMNNRMIGCLMNAERLTMAGKTTVDMVCKEGGGAWQPFDSLTKRPTKQAGPPPIPGPSEPSARPQQVVVVDFNMSFGSMVELMIKWAFAAIPAMIVLFVGFMIGSFLLAAFIGGIFGGKY